MEAGLSDPMEERAVTLGQSIRSLIVAPLAGLAILSAPYITRAGGAFPFLLLYLAPFAYGAAVVFVLPIVVAWPRSRGPSYPIAVVWGALSSYLAAVLIFPSGALRLAVLTGFAVPGAISGVVYSWLVRLLSTTEDPNSSGH